MTSEPAPISTTPPIPLSSQHQQQQHAESRTIPLPTSRSHSAQASNPTQREGTTAAAPSSTRLSTPSSIQGTSVTQITLCLEDRLFQWKNILKNLIKYFELRSDSAHRTSQIDSKSIKQLDLNVFSTTASSAETSAGFPQESDFRKAFIHLQEFTQMELADSESLGKYIQVNVVGVLTHWLNEIKSMTRSIRTDIGYGDKQFLQEQTLCEIALVNMNEGLQNRSQVLSALLIHSSKRKQEGIEDVSILESLDRLKRPEMDPWLIYQDLSHRQGTNSELNRNIQITAKKKQDMYAAFELNLINNLKRILADYSLFEAELVDRLRMKRNSLGQQIEIVEPEKEINLFYSMHPGVFVSLPSLGAEEIADKTSPTTLATALTSSGAQGSRLDSSLLKIEHYGLLAYKKSGILVKGFREYQAILTKTGYLHLYPSNTDLEFIASGIENMGLQEQIASHVPENKTKATPEISICLSDYELRPQPLMGRDPEDIELVNVTKTLFRGKGPNIIELKAVNFEEAKKWWSLMIPYVRQAYQVETVSTEAINQEAIQDIKASASTAPVMGIQREERAL